MLENEMCFRQSHNIEVSQGAIFMEQIMRFGLIYRLAILKKKIWAVKYVTFEGVFFTFSWAKKIFIFL